MYQLTKANFLGAINGTFPEASMGYVKNRKHPVYQLKEGEELVADLQGVECPGTLLELFPQYSEGAIKKAFETNAEFRAAYALQTRRYKTALGVDIKGAGKKLDEIVWDEPEEEYEPTSSAAEIEKEQFTGIQITNKVEEDEWA